MKILLQLIIISCILFCSLDSTSQTKNYYFGSDGNIKSEASYLKAKNTAEAKMKSVSRRLELHETLELTYERNDSIVYAYSWLFTDNVKKTLKEELKEKEMIGKVYPIYDVRTMGGKPISIDDLKGKPTLINLWFTTCHPCIAEMPALNQMKADHNDRFNFLAITFENETKVKKLLLKHPFTFDHIVGSRALTTKLGFKGFPMNIFLDKDGVVVAIEGNVPFEKGKDGKSKMSNGHKFIEKLEQLL